MNSLVYFSFFFVILNLYFFIYNFAFKKLFPNINYVKGSGLIFIVIIIQYFFLNNDYIREINYFNIILILSLIYFIDDIIGLNIISRIILQFLSGIICAYIFLDQLDNFFIYKLFLLGIWSIYLTNSLNFYDGKNLNFAFLLIIILIFNYFIANNSISNIFIILILSFIIFSFYNHFFKKYYFGDSGCFVIAAFLNYLLITNATTDFNNIIIYFIPLCLPFVDVIFVILYRIYKKEDLTTRNHYHLYQRICENYSGYLYLLPTLFSSLILFCIYIMYSFNYIGLVLYFVISLFFLIIFYFYLFSKLLKGK